MGVIEPHPSIGMFGAAAAPPVVVGRRKVHGLLQRIDSLVRLKASLPLLAPDRERDFRLAIDEACLAVARGVESEVAAAIFALDFLSLELCDE